MAMKAYKTVDAYLKDVPEAPRTHLAKVRATVKTLAPDAGESISYGLPTFKYKGKPLIYYGATSKHLALYGGLPASVDPGIIAKYDTSKGTIRFPLDKPIPAALVKRIVKGRMAEIDAKAAAKTAASKGTARKAPAKKNATA